ncbi:helix-turn-helix transcriptional regulator [Lentzea sp. NPDC042327]|uniref:helix-turn-helix domain-containing protein n=1 Tax=Lentzea sp. NPDC042327 TaxID=3154801 RepID=UPI0033D0EF03
MSEVVRLFSHTPVSHPVVVGSTSAHQAGDEDSTGAYCRDFDDVFKRRGISLREAARLSGWGKSTIDSARKGPGLPNKALVGDVLQALGLDADEVGSWLARHDRLTAGRTAARSVDVAAEQTPPATRRHVNRLAVAAVAIGLAVGSGFALTTAFDSDGFTKAVDGRATDPPPGSKEVLVQNKVAIGPTTLREDDSPSYLSSRTVSRCTQNDCKLAGTDVYSGARLTAYCRTDGEWLTNADISSEGIKQNPGLVASQIWYGIYWVDGRRGFISEVYLEEGYRGGLDLPPC